MCNKNRIAGYISCVIKIILRIVNQTDVQNSYSNSWNVLRISAFFSGRKKFDNRIYLTVQPRAV